MITNRVYTASMLPCGMHILQSITIPGYTQPKPTFKAGILRTPFGTCTMFPTGRMVINRCRAEGDAQLTADYCLDALDVIVFDLELVNIVGMVDSGKKVNLEKVYNLTGGIYLPEVQPGLTLWYHGVGIRLHHNGKAVFCGCKSTQQYKDVCQYLLTLINTQ